MHANSCLLIYRQRMIYDQCGDVWECVIVLLAVKGLTVCSAVELVHSSSAAPYMAVD